MISTGRIKVHLTITGRYLHSYSLVFREFPGVFAFSWKVYTSEGVLLNPYPPKGLLLDRLFQRNYQRLPAQS